MSSKQEEEEEGRLPPLPAVEGGVPRPEVRRKRRWAFHLMSVGDSFFAPVPAEVLTNAAAYRRRKGEQHSVRSVTEQGVHGARIWRVR